MGPFNILILFSDTLYGKAIAARLALERPAWSVSLDAEGFEPDLIITDTYSDLEEHPDKTIFINDAVSLSALLARIDSYRVSRGLLNCNARNADPKDTKLICVTAPPGIKGCTTCAALLSQRLVSESKRILFLSLDMAESVRFPPEGLDEPEPDDELSGLLMGLIRQISGAGASAASNTLGDHLNSCLRTTMSGLHFIPVSRGLNPLFFLDHEGFQAFLDLICKEAGFDAVVIDCPMEHPVFPGLAPVCEITVLIGQSQSHVTVLSERIVKEMISDKGRLLQFYPSFDNHADPFDVYCQLGGEVSRFARESGL